MWLRGLALFLVAVLLVSFVGYLFIEKDLPTPEPVTVVKSSLPVPAKASSAPVPTYTAETPKSYVVTEYKSEEAEPFLWECLSRYSPNDAVTAGLLAMFWRESFFRSDSTAHWSEVLMASGIDQPAVFTAEVDAGLANGSTRELFVDTVHYSIGGYGLGQWYGYALLESLYDFAREWGTSIADAEMQCAFAVKSLEEFSEVWEQLVDTNDPQLAGHLIALNYDGTHSGYPFISELAEVYYKKYAELPETEEVTEP